MEDLEAIAFAEKPYMQSVDASLNALRTKRSGLNAIAVHSRLEKFGTNVLPHVKSPALIALFFRQFADPLIYVLLCASFITLCLKQYGGASFILVVLFVNAIVGTAQEYSANRTALALKKMTTSSVKVRRDDIVQEINPVQLVLGDIIMLESGNRVPADIRLIKIESDLKIDESLLTGETDSVYKDVNIILTEETIVADRLNMAFAGTIVTSGRATGVVVAIGSDTEMGKVAAYLAQEEETKSPLLIRMEYFTVQIALFMGLLVLITSIVLYIQGVYYVDILLTAIGLAVAGIPEGLPVTLTIALAIGMRRMAKRNVIIRKMASLEALGSCTLIASDKTGTLTYNKLRVEHIVLPSNEHFIISENGALLSETSVDGRPLH